MITDRDLHKDPRYSVRLPPLWHPFSERIKQKLATHQGFAFKVWIVNIDEVHRHKFGRVHLRSVRTTVIDWK